MYIYCTKCGSWLVGEDMRITVDTSTPNCGTRVIADFGQPYKPEAPSPGATPYEADYKVIN